MLGIFLWALWLLPFQLLPWRWIPEGGGSAYILCPRGPFRWSLLEIWQFLPPPQPLLVFIVRSYGALSSWSWNPGLCGLVWGWDSSLPRCPSRFLSTTWECGAAHSITTPSPSHTASLPLLPIWVNVASLNPWLVAFHTARFSDGSGCDLSLR